MVFLFFFFVKWMNQIEKWNWFIIIYYLWLLRFSKAYTISNWLHFSQHHVLFSWQFLRLFDVAISYFIYTQKIHREKKKLKWKTTSNSNEIFRARKICVLYGCIAYNKKNIWCTWRRGTNEILRKMCKNTVH